MELPIKHWTFSSLMAFLRNPLAWHKRYVEKVYDIPSSPSGIVGRSAHTALQHYYSGLSKEAGVDLGLEYLRKIPDFEINFGKLQSKRAKKWKRAQMEKDYLQATRFYLARPPRYDVLGVEVMSVAKVKGIPLPLKAISDLVVRSKKDPGAIDIVDHKFVDSFSKLGAGKSLFIFQALFNYYTVKEAFGERVRHFIVHECKKTGNMDGSSQMREYVIDFEQCGEEFELFHRLINDATKEISRERIYLPNPSDMFEGEDSLNIYRLGLIE